MDPKKFVAFKYAHAGRAERSPQRWRIIWIAMAAALVATVAEFPLGALALLLPLGIYLSAPKRLYIGPRYLICGEALIYFGNVVQVDLDPAAGTLTLVSANQRSLVLERDSFPTNARKDFKVARNKAAKFDKVTAKIVERVRLAAPQAAMRGVAADAPGR